MQFKMCMWFLNIIIRIGRNIQWINLLTGLKSILILFKLDAKINIYECVTHAFVSYQPVGTMILEWC